MLLSTTRRLAPLMAVQAVLGLAASADPASAQAAEVAALGWMQGCWERATRSGAVEEQWTAPRGGTMLGVSRTVRGDSTVAWEYLRIVPRDGGLVYVATPSGQATAEFTATTVSDTLVVFENPAHDFPQRILYRPAAGDSLHARIEGPRGGEVRGVDFRYGRVGCPGG